MSKKMELEKQNTIEHFYLKQQTQSLANEQKISLEERRQPNFGLLELHSKFSVKNSADAFECVLRQKKGAHA